MDVAFEEPQLRILLHDGVVLQAPLHGVKCMSACACNLPADAAEWDLSGLLIDGKPVSQDTVKAWIGAVYKQLGDRQYADELNEASRTMEGLYQLLRFADAVGSRQGVLPTFLAHVDGLELLVPCPGNHVTLIADGRVYSVKFAGRIVHECPIQGEKIVGDSGNVEGRVAALQAITTQLEQLLWLAHKLQLAPLITSLHTFIHSSVVMRGSMLHGHLDSMFTQRVKEAALCNSQTLSAQQWINSIVAQPAAITDEMERGFEAPLLAPLGGSDAAPEWQFQARLTRPYLGLPAGTEVEARLDLGEGILYVGELPLLVQLLVGPAACSAQNKATLMGG